MFPGSPPAPACRHAGRGNHALYLVRRRHAGMPDVGVMPSVSRPAPACRTWEACPLYLVRRRHASMPDVGVMPSVSRQAPACRHAGMLDVVVMPSLSLESMNPTSGMLVCRRRTRYREHDSHVRHAGIPAPDKIQRA